MKKLYLVYDITIYDVIFVNMISYVTASTSQCIPRTCTKGTPGTFMPEQAVISVCMLGAMNICPHHCDLILITVI